MTDVTAEKQKGPLAVVVQSGYSSSSSDSRVYSYGDLPTDVQDCKTI